METTTNTKVWNNYFGFRWVQVNVLDTRVSERPSLRNPGTTWTLHESLIEMPASSQFDDNSPFWIETEQLDDQPCSDFGPDAEWIGREGDVWPT